LQPSEIQQIPVIRVFGQRLVSSANAHRVALTACLPKSLIIFDTTLKTEFPIAAS
jgi:hypothetical protein